MYIINSLTIGTKAEYSAAFWEIVVWFGHVKFDELNGININRLDNILTLNVNAHRSFDDLKLWFEEVPVGSFVTFVFSTLTLGKKGLADHYKIVAVTSSFKAGSHAKEEVQFMTSDPKEMPVPNPVYLRLHAACAKIAHMSGMGELLEHWENELDKTGVLAADGSSMALLLSRLTPLCAPGHLNASSTVQYVA
jgi:hypothetical protein